MPTADDIERIALAMNVIRPKWPKSSLITFLTKNHAHRAFRDLLVAGIVVATDPRTDTPRLLNEHGPWWLAAQAANGTYTDTRFARCPEPGHTSFPAHNCSACRAEQIEGTHPGTTPVMDPDQQDINARGARRARAALGIPTGGDPR
jgi:hypothetical protein